jgi:hypothetical protein
MQFPQSLVLGLALFRSTNAYSLVSTFDSSNFFNEFGFFTSGDPTDGFVDYVSQSVADSTDLVNTNNGQVYIGVDYTSYQPSGGRNSVRVTSNQAYSELSSSASSTSLVTTAMEAILSYLHTNFSQPKVSS